MRTATTRQALCSSRGVEHNATTARAWLSAPRSTAKSSRRGARLTCRAAMLGGLMEKAAAANAEMLARKEGSKLLKDTEPLKRFPIHVLDEKADIVAKVLQTAGVVSLQAALTPETCDTVLKFVNAESERAKAAVEAGEVEFGEYFGGVNCRGMNGLFGNRQDMFLPMSDPTVQLGMQEAVRRLGPLLEAAVTRQGMVHEVSSIVSDPGSPRQCVHADTIYMPCRQYPVHMAPLYTFFIALQDIDDDMGHTTFLPRTHTGAAHELWNTTPKQKETFVSKSPSVISGLKKGDVAIFDSRLLHCGGANSSQKRRVLFYFTVSEAQRWPLPNGLHGSNSIRAEDRWKYQLCDLGL